MKICLTTRLEISKQNEIIELLKLYFPDCKIKFVIKARKYKKKPIKKKTIGNVKSKNFKKINKQMSYLQKEWLEDYRYNKQIQEDGINKIIDHYTKIKKLEY